MAGPVERKSSDKGPMVVILIVVGALFCFLVVPMIGILAAIAIPNFLKFQCKAKQSEAKTNLAGLYTAEKVFYGEYGTYTSDLVALNWQPDGSPVYVYGFAQPGPGLTHAKAAQLGLTDYDERRDNTANSAVVTKGGYSTARMKDLSGKSLSGRDLPADAVVSSEAFVAAAAGDIDTDPSVQLDLWTIDDTRALVSDLNDCTR